MAFRSGEHTQFNTAKSAFAAYMYMYMYMYVIPLVRICLEKQYILAMPIQVQRRHWSHEGR